MNSKIAKKIRKYSKLRGIGDERMSPKVLKKIFEKSSPKDQQEYIEEMDKYIQAIESGKIKPGESLILSGLPRSKSESAGPKG